MASPLPHADLLRFSEFFETEIAEWLVIGELNSAETIAELARWSSIDTMIATAEAAIVMNDGPSHMIAEADWWFPPVVASTGHGVAAEIVSNLAYSIRDATDKVAGYLVDLSSEYQGGYRPRRSAFDIVPVDPKVTGSGVALGAASDDPLVEDSGHPVTETSEWLEIHCRKITKTADLPYVDEADMQRLVCRMRRERVMLVARSGDDDDGVDLKIWSELMNVKEAAAVIGISDSGIRSRISRGDPEVLKEDDNRYRVKKSVIAEREKARKKL